MQPDSEIVEPVLQGLATGLFLIIVAALILELAMLALKPILNNIGAKIGLNGGLAIILGLIIGVLIAVWLGADLFHMVFGTDKGWLGIGLTGLIIGRGASWVIGLLPWHKDDLP